MRGDCRKMNQSIIRDPSLAAEGMQRIQWVEKFMPVLNALRKEMKGSSALKGKTVVMSIHLEAKTAYLALTLQAAGARVIATGSNPLSTQDPIAAGLDSQGICVYATHGCTDQEYTDYLNHALDHHPDLIIDDGGDLVSLLHTTRKEAGDRLLGGSEETTTGVQRLRNLEKKGALRFPMIAVNDAYCKYLFDNRYGTGQSVWDGIIRSTNLTVTGKTVVVAGYGWCGKGVSMRAKGLGAHVIVTEVDPIKAVEAVFDGFSVMPMDKAAEAGDIFITVTGDINVITKQHFLKMKDGAICANAGHFDVEVSRKDLEEICISHQEARKNIEGYVMPGGHTVYLMAEGRLVNLAAGDGHPAEIMDLSFAMQMLAAVYLAEHAGEMKPRVYILPHELDRKVAGIKLASMGYEMDSLTEEQKEYLSHE